jgi:hypothetical protein
MFFFLPVVYSLVLVGNTMMVMCIIQIYALQLELAPCQNHVQTTITSSYSDRQKHRRFVDMSVKENQGWL